MREATFVVGSNVITDVGFALVIKSCCCFTKYTVIGIPISMRREKIPNQKNLFVKNVIVLFWPSYTENSPRLRLFISVEDFESSVNK